MGILHVVATPIGNLEDVTLRALRVLREADLVLVEDTRHTRVLLDRHGIKANRLVSLHAHNEAARCARALEVLDAGGQVALCSDAGTPLLSDPGARLVASAIAAGHAVSPVPGPTAIAAALCAAGLDAARFSFAGFLPRRTKERRALLDELAPRRDALVFFESPRRIGETLRELADAFGDRRACVARELTKLHEELARGTLSELAARFADGARGEITLVVEGISDELRDAAAPQPGDLDAEIRARLARGEGVREIAASLAAASGIPRRQIYARALAMRDTAPPARRAPSDRGD
ncbi:MAG TPA: 16S rRNA (cytidine(1402)-2'-O)-methyltransferase [Myxococcota bacterium]|nr:16S rRNA (cytidine(1402)-2'-O)-methyltransferase [Myxococcota bacterium]